MYFNYFRKFRYKFGKYPFQILIEYEMFKNNNPFAILTFFPIILNLFIKYFNFSLPLCGYHVHISVIKIKFEH